MTAANKPCKDSSIPPPPIFNVYFEDYLKPKTVKNRNSLLFSKQASQKSQLRLKLLEHPVLVAGSNKSKRTLLSDNLQKQFQSKFKKTLKLQEENSKTSTRFSLGNIRLPRFLTFLNARNDHVTCKRKSGFEIYCEIASIHGFNNFVGATTWQRALWFLIILMAVIMSAFVVLLSHFMQVTTPTILYSESTQHPTWSIPFPAVTICNLNQISKIKTDNLANMFQETTTTNMSLDELSAFFKLALATRETVKLDLGDYKKLNQILKRENYTLLKLIDSIAPNSDKQLKTCIFQGEVQECGNLFRQTQTSFGQCCSFNYKALKKTSSSSPTIYTATDQMLYISNCGYTAGLSVLLDPELEDYRASAMLTAGFRVLIHDAHDVPNIATMQRIITPATSNKVSVTPQQTYATDHISSLEISARKCYLPNERKLYYFGSYSQANCLAECRSSLVYEKCRCSLPYEPKMSNWTVCGLEDISCYVKYKSLLMSDLNCSPSNSHDEHFICDCYPLCDFQIYNIALDSGGLTRKYSKTEKRLYKDVVNVTNHILLRVFISDLYAERSRLDVYENWLSFLGTFGGITGLFMGYSFLSGFELIFFVFVRPACNWLTKKQIAYRLKKRQQKAQQEKRQLEMSREVRASARASILSRLLRLSEKNFVNKRIELN